MVGIFDARGTVMEAEIWMPLQDLMTFTQRDFFPVLFLLSNQVNHLMMPRLLLRHAWIWNLLLLKNPITIKAVYILFSY